MFYKSLFLFVCVFAYGISSLSYAVEAKANEEKPNVILLMSDDQGWGDVGFNGNSEIKTPHLDAMAANGVRFNRFYASAPLCSPTRVSCLTGRYPYRSGVLAAHTAGMRRGEITIAEALKKQGYHTGFFGKWHMGWVKPDEVSSRGYYSPPWHHGYDVSFATTSAVPTWDPTVTPKGWTKWGAKEGEPWKHGTAYVQDGVEVTENLDGDDSRIIMDRVIPFIEEHRDEPFFATVWFHTPHEPVVAGPEYLAMYPGLDEEQQHYYGCITAMDDQIGRLRDKLRELKIERNTVVFFCSDNGPSGSITRKGVASAGPFKGHKHRMYEGGHLVPSTAEWPGVIEPGQATDIRTSTVDYFPTIANLTGYKFRKNEERPIDGIDLMPVIRGEQKSRDKDLFMGYRRLINGIDGAGLIRGDIKLLREANKDARVRLYNLKDDPYETKDLAKTNPKLLAKMLEALEEIDRSCQLSRDGNDYRY